MAQRALVRGSIAVAATFAMASGLAYATAPAARADTPSESVIPAALGGPTQDTLIFAGPGGFLHRTASGMVWTPYSGGSNVTLPGTTAYTSIGPAGYWGNDSDVVTTTAGSTVTFHDMDAGATTSITLSPGQHYFGTYGSRVLIATTQSGSPTAWSILTMSGGQLTETPVTGIPTGMGFNGVRAADASSLVVTYGANNNDQLGLLDLASGQLTPLNSGQVSTVTIAVLSGQNVAWYDPEWNPVLHLLNRADPSGPVTTVQVPKPSLPGMNGATVQQLGIVGDSLLVNYSVTFGGSGAPTSGDTGDSLYAMPLTGGSLSTVVDHMQGSIQTGSNGALAVGGSSPADWAARRITVASNGTLTSTTVNSDPQVPEPIDGLSLAGGQLVTIEESTNAFTRNVQLGSPPTYGAHTAFGGAVVDSSCGVAGACAPPIGSGDGRMSQLIASSSGDSVAVEGPGVTSEMHVSSGGGSLVGSDGRFVVYDNASTATQYIGDMTTSSSSHVLFSRPLTAAALSGETLWSATSTAGVVSSIDLSTQQTTHSINAGAPCVPTELQAAAGRWLYWSCGNSGPAGVYDLATSKDTSVPSGLSELGDGYIVEHDTTAGKLVLTDFHDDAPVTSDLADLPAPTAPLTDDRQVTWTVDKYGGGIAYLDAQHNIHVVDPHVPASPASGYRMLPGQRLNPGDSLTSGSMRLVMQTDGNLVAYLKAGGNAAPAEWASGTSGHPGAYAVMQPDGNLVVYSQNGGPGIGGALWASGTSGSPGASATLQDDGNLVVYRQGTSDSHDALWSSGSYARSQTISSGEKLQAGWWTQSRYTFLVMQPDGNLVMYRKRDGAAIWSSNTSGHRGAYAYMQSDGNLVIYKSGGGPITGGALSATGTNGHPGAYAIMQDDGNLVVYKSGGGPSTGGAIWATGTYKDVP